MPNDPKIPGSSPLYRGATRRPDAQTSQTAKNQPPRAGLTPKVNIPTSQAQPAKREFKLAIPLWLWGGLMVLVLVCVAFVVFRAVRETRVTFHIDSGDLKIAGDPMVIYNFIGKLDLLRNDFSRRTATIDAGLREVQNNLLSARADLAGVLEKKRLLTAEQDRLNNEVKQTQVPNVDNQVALDKLWEKEGKKLDEEYAAKRDYYQQQLSDHAKKMGVNYERNTDVNSVDVSVNAYKLALYGVPKSVKVDEERKYADDLLAEWQKYQDDWHKRLQAIKDEAVVIRQKPQVQTKGVQEQINTVQRNIASADSEVASYQVEIQQYEGQQRDLNAQRHDIAKQFNDDLLQAPKDFVKTRLKLAAGNVAELRIKEEQADDSPAGDYYLLVTATKDNEIYWALKKFTLKPFSKQKVTVQRSDFASISNYLSDADAPPLTLDSGSEDKTNESQPAADTASTDKTDLPQRATDSDNENKANALPPAVDSGSSTPAELPQPITDTGSGDKANVAQPVVETGSDASPAAPPPAADSNNENQANAPQPIVDTGSDDHQPAAPPAAPADGSQGDNK